MKKTTPSIRVAVCTISAAFVLASCAGMNGMGNSGQGQNTAVGAGAGALAGAGLGALIGDSSKSAAIGAGVGALAGGIAGYNWNRIKQDVQESGANDLGIDVVEMPDGSLKVNIPSNVSFDTGKYDLKPALIPVLDSVANALNEHQELQAVALGHTDNTGSDAINQPLSVNRAQSVTNYLGSKGVASNRLNARGMSSNDPIADNSTAEGRAANRRVELYLFAPKQQ